LACSSNLPAERPENHSFSDPLFAGFSQMAYGKKMTDSCAEGLSESGISEFNPNNQVVLCDETKQRSNTCICNPENIMLNGIAVERRKTKSIPERTQWLDILASFQEAVVHMLWSTTAKAC
jgi:hypothetical protein